MGYTGLVSPSQLDSIQTGSRWLSRHNSIGGHVIAALSQGYSHVGLFIRVTPTFRAALDKHFGHVSLKIDQLLVFESTLFPTVPDLVTGRRVCGVGLVDANDRLKSHRGKGWIRRFNSGAKRQIHEDALIDIVIKHHGKKYETNPWEFVFAVFTILNLRRSNSASLFCSELQALSESALGILNTQKPNGKHLPGDFSSRARRPLSLHYGAFRRETELTKEGLS